MLFVTETGLATDEVQVNLLILVAQGRVDVPELFDPLVVCLTIHVDCHLFEQSDTFSLVLLVLVSLGQNHKIMPVQVLTHVVKVTKRLLDAMLDMFDLLLALSNQPFKKFLTELFVVVPIDRVPLAQVVDSFLRKVLLWL